MTAGTLDDGLLSSLARGCILRDTLLLMEDCVQRDSLEAAVCSLALEEGKVLILVRGYEDGCTLADSLGRHLPESAVCRMNGEVYGYRRPDLVRDHGVLISSPGSVLTDISKGRYSLDSFRMVIAHDAEDYSWRPGYVKLSGLIPGHVRRMGIASGGDSKALLNACANLGLRHAVGLDPSVPEVTEGSEPLSEKAEWIRGRLGTGDIVDVPLAQKRMDDF